MYYIEHGSSAVRSYGLKIKVRNGVEAHEDTPMERDLCGKLGSISPGNMENSKENSIKNCIENFFLSNADLFVVKFRHRVTTASW
jgi:hypothetical protein